MKFTILILVCLMASAYALNQPLVEDNSQYKWLSDIWRINVDLWIVLICGTYFWILTFFANEP